MNDIYLHHYKVSPFAEKVRLMLGHKKLAWRSVMQPMVMPKGDLLALTGGYRRIPVLQVGSDVVCDTALIADVLEHIAPEPALYPAGQKGLARTVAQWADAQLFTAAMGYNFQPAGAAHVFAGNMEAMKAFGADRTAMRSGAPRMAPADATATYKSFLRRISSTLHEQPFLLGQAPSLADFSAYHPLWFTQANVPPLAGVLEATPLVLAWMARMAAIGHGSMSKSTPEEALAAAQASSGEASLFADHSFVDEHGIALGSAVRVRAESFGLEETEGTLLAATRTRYTLGRTDARTGAVRVHFPRVGYVLSKAE